MYECVCCTRLLAHSTIVWWHVEHGKLEMSEQTTQRQQLHRRTVMLCWIENYSVNEIFVNPIQFMYDVAWRNSWMHFGRMCSKFVVNFVIIILLSLPFCVAGHGLLCNEFEFHLEWKKILRPKFMTRDLLWAGPGPCTTTQRHKRKSGIPFQQSKLEWNDIEPPWICLWCHLVVVRRSHSMSLSTWNFTY